MQAVREWTHDGRPELTGGDYRDPAPPGPWYDEPDKRQWIDPETDLDCLMVRNHYGVWCGYVAVTEDHLYFEVGYDECDVSVHGGLTFASFCAEDAPEGFGICHVPSPGRPGRVWWLGFDCGHYMDLQPGYPELTAMLPHQVYRDVAYVESQCTELARQLAAVVR